MRSFLGNSRLFAMQDVHLRMPPSIQITDLRVDYEELTAVKGLHLTIGPGEIYGLVGPNGAGKTSTFNVLATLLEPTYGEVKLCGIDIREEPENARRLFGHMPDFAPVPSDLKVWEFLDFFAGAYDIPASQRSRRIDHCLELVGLSGQRNTFCKTLSRGMSQRVVFAKTLLHRPRLLLLDEPASGMDPQSRVRLRKALQSLAQDGVTTLISSHILVELAGMCTQIGIFHHGHLLATGSPRAIVQQMGRSPDRTAA
ncbi:MAG: ABC transporter ATP-binding protein, partial [Bdellovibrionaceae bacterium]|nr:ABC transporter ATP-binding protein [Pseudobdellovibrionaceae bacterium]